MELVSNRDELWVDYMKTYGHFGKTPGTIGLTYHHSIQIYSWSSDSDLKALIQRGSAGCRRQRHVLAPGGELPERTRVQATWHNFEWLEAWEEFGSTGKLSWGFLMKTEQRWRSMAYDSGSATPARLCGRKGARGKTRSYRGDTQSSATRDMNKVGVQFLSLKVKKMSLRKFSNELVTKFDASQKLRQEKSTVTKWQKVIKEISSVTNNY